MNRIPLQIWLKQIIKVNETDDEKEEEKRKQLGRTFGGGLLRKDIHGVQRLILSKTQMEFKRISAEGRKWKRKRGIPKDREDFWEKQGREKKDDIELDHIQKKSLCDPSIIVGMVHQN